MYYTAKYTIPSYLCDHNDKLTMWGLARLFQDVAGGHVEKEGLGFASLIEQGKAWVLCRSLYQINRLPKECEEITIKTWSRGTDGLFAFREYQVFDNHNNIIASCSSYWAVIDFVSRHVIRLNNLMDKFEHHDDSSTGFNKIDRIRFPHNFEPKEIVSQFTVTASMLDHTLHVNNAEYIKWIFDNLFSNPLSIISSPFTLIVEYPLETKPEETISIFKFSDDLSTFFQISNPRGVAFKAKLVQL